MKKLLFILGLFYGTAQAQTDSVIYYTDSLVYRIDTTIIAGDDTIISDSTYILHFCHYISVDSIYENQFIIIEGTIINHILNMLVPIQPLIDVGYSSSGTVLRKKLNATQMSWTPLQLRDSLILPDLKLIYGNSNVTKL